MRINVIGLYQLMVYSLKLQRDFSVSLSLTLHTVAGWILQVWTPPHQSSCPSLFQSYYLPSKQTRSFVIHSATI